MIDRAGVWDEGPSHPSGTVTFLMTDVQGSTRSWEARPEAMDESLRLHDEVMRAEAERANGYIFSTAGDSFAIAFASAGGAIAAAIEVQRKLLDAAWPSGLPIRVRMGLHTGHMSQNAPRFGSGQRPRIAVRGR